VTFTVGDKVTINTGLDDLKHFDGLEGEVSQVGDNQDVYEYRVLLTHPIQKKLNTYWFFEKELTLN
jgi:hypothetical protein